MRKLPVFSGLALAAVLIGQESGLFPILLRNARVGLHGGGFYLLPTYQLLHPWGEQAAIKGRPVDLAFDSRKHLLAVLNWRSVLLFDGASGAQIAEVRSRATSYTGIAFRPGDRELWASEATRNGPDSLLILELSELGAVTKSERVSLPGHPLSAGIAFSRDGKTAYVALNRNNTLAVIDAGSRQVQREVAVGMAPFAVLTSGRRVFVTNRGGRRPAVSDGVAPSSGSMIATDQVTGSSISGTLSVVDAGDFSTREAAAGLAPSGLALSADDRQLAVANSHSDSISLVEANTLRAIEVKIDTWPEGTLGSQPVAAAFAPDGRTVYVACGGNNAMVVVRREGEQWKVAGALPKGWFPSAVAVDGEGALRVVTIKGLANTSAGNGTFNSRQYEGSLARIPAPTDAQLAAGVREVRAANSPRFEPAGGVANLSSLGIRHVFLSLRKTAPTIRSSATSAKATAIRSCASTAAILRLMRTRWPNSMCCSITSTRAAPSVSTATSG
jgi:YVTN family beta-propeller protein